MTELRPMALGEIVDRSASFWRASWRRLYGLFFTFSLVQYALVKGAQALIGRWTSYGDLFAMLQGMLKNPQATQALAPAATAGFMAVFVVILFGTLFTTTAAAHWVLPTFLGKPARVLDGVAHAARKLPTLVALFLLALGWAALALVGFALPGFVLGVVGGVMNSVAVLIVGMALLMAGTLAWGLWFFLRFALWGPVVASEDVSALAAFKRCDTLTSGRLGPGLMGLVKMRLMLLISVVAMLLLLISLLSGAPVLILRGIWGNLLDPSAADVPAYLLVPAELLNLAVGAVMYPLYVAFQVIFYVDMRVRREGFDLELQLKETAA